MFCTHTSLLWRYEQRNLSNFYSKLIDVGYATEKDIYDALYAGIRNEDISLVAKCLSMLPPQDEWNNEDYPYPTGKIQILGQLIPGTETRFKAFSGYIEFGEIDHETLCNIIQSSCNRGFGCIGSRSDSKRQQRKRCSSPIGSGKKAG